MRIIGGKFKGRSLIAPKGDRTRPTTDRTRESLFNILSNMIDFEGVRVLDLFAGTGALGIEALSRGASGATFVENANTAISALRANIEAFDLADDISIIKGDAAKLAPADLDDPFDLVFADPPYGKGFGEKAAENALANNWLASDALFVLEESLEHVPANLRGFSLIDQRRYGSTSISIFRRMS